VARPTKLTSELQTAIVERVAAGNYLAVAARASGVHRDTLYGWLERGRAGEEPFAAFSDALKRAEAEAECAAVAYVRSGEQGWQASAWYLERKYPDRWASDRKKKRAELAALRRGDGASGAVRVVLEYEPGGDVAADGPPAVAGDAPTARDPGGA
jgi:hypothetical protein